MLNPAGMMPFPGPRATGRQVAVAGLATPVSATINASTIAAP
jgi:hypothetical protein